MPATLKMASTSRARRQSGVIPYRRVCGGIEVMLITSRSGQRLIVPKGCIEPDLTAIESAQKEALEEAGIVGRPDLMPIGSIDGVRNRQRCVIDLWPMRVTRVHATWLEMSFRQRLWMPALAAAQLVDRADLAALILRLADRFVKARIAA
jgi:8-oxo-dGTP pyrophosphatase MutT (NUDIX family)